MLDYLSSAARMIIEIEYSKAKAQGGYPKNKQIARRASRSQSVVGLIAVVVRTRANLRHLELDCAFEAVLRVVDLKIPDRDVARRLLDGLGETATTTKAKAAAIVARAAP